SPDGKFAAAVEVDPTAAVGKDHRFLIWNTVDSEPILQRKFPESLFGLAMSPDSKKVVMSEERIARIYDLNAPQKAPVCLPHPDAVLSAAFHPRNPKVLLTGFVGGALLWDLDKLEERKPLQHLTGVFAVGFSPDGETLVTAGQDSQARLWDAGMLKQ